MKSYKNMMENKQKELSNGKKVDIIHTTEYLYTFEHESDDRGANFKSRHPEENEF
ncbi:hypothetical protein GCM10008982_20140 [Anoxybacillus voinovskiensis]|nr:hypothetical protein GCM10008982_20140 [Anoxybacillus voinovskiensis]